MSPKKQEKTHLEIQEEYERASCPARIAYRCEATPKQNGRIIPIKHTAVQRESGRNLNLLKMQSSEPKKRNRRIDVRKLVLAPKSAYAAEIRGVLSLATRLREEHRVNSGRYPQS